MSRPTKPSRDEWVRHNPPFTFAPGTLQGCRRPPGRLAKWCRTWLPALGLGLAVLLVLGSERLANWLAVWSRS